MALSSSGGPQTTPRKNDSITTGKSVTSQSYHSDAEGEGFTDWHTLSYMPNKCVTTHRQGCLLCCPHPVPGLEPAHKPALRAPKFLHGPSPTELGRRDDHMLYKKKSSQHTRRQPSSPQPALACPHQLAGGPTFSGTTEHGGHGDPRVRGDSQG